MPATDQRLRPLYPLAEMVTWELSEYRSELERVLALDPLPTHYLPRNVLQKQLDDVLAEQAERAEMRHAKPAQADA